MALTIIFILQFYGKDEKFYIDEALDKIEILKERFPDAIDDLLYVAECIKHLSDDTEE